MLDAVRLAVLVADRGLGLAVGSQPGSTCFRRTSARRRASRCASAIGAGISSGVSLVA
jgi:hypothetical protein